MRTVLFWAVILAAALVLWQVTKNGSQNSPPEISYSEFMSRVQAGNISEVKLQGRRASVFDRDRKSFFVIVPASQADMLAVLEQNKVEIWFSDDATSTWGWVSNLMPIALLAALWFFMIRRMSANRGRVSVDLPRT